MTMMKLPIIDNDRFLKESPWATWEVFVMMTRDVFPTKQAQKLVQVDALYLSL